jgi:hypothetical protein
MFLKRIGDVLEKDEAKNDVLVLCGVHVAPELVGSEPELRFETDVG